MLPKLPWPTALWAHPIFDAAAGSAEPSQKPKPYKALGVRLTIAPFFKVNSLRYFYLYEVCMPGPGPSRFASIADNISLSPDGLNINGKLVIRQIGPFYLPLVVEEQTSPEVMSKLSKISTLLKDGNTYSAIISASTTNWLHLDSFIKYFAKANFNPFEARDHRGRWTRGDQQSSDANVAEIGYNGFLHDAVVDDLVNAFRKVGAKAETNVIVSGLPGVPAIPDIVVLPVGAKLPIVIEVKTGQSPPFTPNQQYVYPLLCIGGPREVV